MRSEERRWILGFDMKTGSSVIENPRWMSQTRVRKLFKPIARLFNGFKYEPLVDGYWPSGNPNEYAGSIGAGPRHEDKGMIGILARIELNEEDGKDLSDGLPKNALSPKD